VRTLIEKINLGAGLPPILLRIRFGWTETSSAENEAPCCRAPQLRLLAHIPITAHHLQEH